ncbi:MAG: hypothetical protein GEU81_14230 [Nitriliruptorales bacterium]|nr:hypothetical protein [Nitriliruptorales bacterium]
MQGGTPVGQEGELLAQAQRVAPERLNDGGARAQVLAAQGSPQSALEQRQAVLHVEPAQRHAATPAAQARLVGGEDDHAVGQRVEQGANLVVSQLDIVQQHQGPHIGHGAADLLEGGLTRRVALHKQVVNLLQQIVQRLLARRQVDDASRRDRRRVVGQAAQQGGLAHAGFPVEFQRQGIRKRLRHRRPLRFPSQDIGRDRRQEPVGARPQAGHEGRAGGRHVQQSTVGGSEEEDVVTDRHLADRLAMQLRRHFW